MADFSITSAVNLQKPGNLDQISNLIRNKLENINVKVGVGVDSAAARKLDTIGNSLKRTSRESLSAADSMEAFGKQTAITIRRFGAYTLATAGFFKFVRSVNQGIKEAIQFQDQLVKIRQVTGESISSLSALTNEIDKLSTTLGVSSKELLDASQVLAQAGLNAREVRVALQALAKSDLAPTFDNINRTAEASIAVLKQFGLGVDQLETKLSSINSVSAKFAVESGDITSAIQRTGGAFAAAGGSLEELIALFTSVRATTRESADSIATGFRTIFTRIQRTRTQNFLGDLGVDLRDLGEEARKFGREGLFVGPYKAIERLSEALNELDSSDPRFAQIVEELGGFRQISKVIPLVQQFAVSENALGVALRGTNSLTEDAEKRQESLAIQIKRVSEEFQVLLRQFGNSQAFKTVSQIVIDITRQLIKLGSVVEGLIAPMALVFGPLLGKSAINFGRGLSSKSFSKKIVPFAKGGQIGGVGNKDTELIAAMPGEFVVRKQSVNKYGVDFFKNLNEGKITKFASGGVVGSSKQGISSSTLITGGLFAFNGLQSLFGDLGQELKTISSLLSVFGVQFVVLNSIIKSSVPGLDKLKQVAEGAKQSVSRREGFLSSTTSGFSDQKKESEKRLNDLNRIISRTELGGSPLARIQSINREKPLLTKDYVSAQRTISKLNFGDENVAKQTELEKIFKERMAVLDVDKANANKDLVRSTKAKEEIKLINDSIKATEDKISQQKRDVEEAKKLQAQYEKQAKIINGLNIGLALAASGLTTFGSYLTNQANESLTRLRSGENVDVNSARRSFTSGATASGGGVGAIGGLALVNSLVSVFGKLTPQTAVLTVAFTSLSAAAFSFFNAQKEFEKQLKLIDIEKTSVNLSNRLTDLQNGINPRLIGGQINQAIEKITSQLRVEVDKDTKDGLNASLDSSISGLIEFVNKTRAVSSSLDGFRSVVSTSTLQLIADKTGKSLTEYVKSIDEAIERQNKNNEALETSIRNNRTIEIGIISQRALNAAAQTSSDSLQNFSTGLNQVATNAALSFGSGISGVFNQIAAGVGGNNNENQLNQFASNFGPAAASLAKTSIDAAKAIELLPNALLDIRAKDPLGGGSGAFADRLGVLLDNANIGGSIRDSILDQVANIIGPEGKDQTIVERINKDLIGVIDEISSGLIERNKDIFTSLEGSTLTALKNFSDGLETARKNLEQITDRRLSQVDNLEFLRNIRSSVTGKDDFATQRVLANERTNVITGGKNPRQLLDELAEAQKKEIELRNQLNSTEDLSARKSIISSINAERTARDKAKRGLEFLADVSNRTAVAQKQLENSTRDRLTKRDLAIQSVFASPQERARENLVVGQARLAISAQSADVIPPQLKQEVLSFLQRLGDTKLEGLGGLSGNEAIDRIVGKALDDSKISREGILDPGKAEKELFKEIQDGVAIANAIQQKLIEEEKELNKRFIADLDTQFDKFLTGLNNQISKIFERERVTRAASITGDIESARAQASGGQQIASISGADAQSVFNNFANIKAFVDEQNRINAQLSGLVPITDAGAARSAVGASISTSGSNVTGEQLLSNLISSFSGNKETFDLLEQTRRDGKFSELISKLNSGINQFNNTLDDGVSGSSGKNLLSDLLFREFSAISKNIQNNLKAEITTGQRTRENLASSVGGDQNLTNIIKNLSALEPIINGLPDKVAFDKLQKTIETLSKKLEVINNPTETFSTGGRVGYGKSRKDTIPAMLAEGEYVVQTSAVSKYGTRFLDQLNNGTLEGYKSGGSVRKKIDDDVIKELKSNIKQREDFISSPLTQFSSVIFNKGNELSEIKKQIKDNKQLLATMEDPLEMEKFENSSKLSTLVERLQNENKGLTADEIGQKTRDRLSKIPKPPTITPENKTYFPKPESKAFSQEYVDSVLSAPLPRSNFDAPKNITPIQSNGFSQDELKMIASGESSSPPIIDYQKISREKRANAIKVQRQQKQNPTINNNQNAIQAPLLNNQKRSPSVPSGAAAIGQPPQIDMAAMNNLNAAMGQFNTSANALAKAISTMPSTISLTANHKVEVIINGAQAFSEMEPSISKMIISTTNKELNRFIEQKFPEVGPMV